MTNDDQATEKDIQQAEVFDALGHPTRVVILKALSEGPAGFAELKKKTGIESSGHLLHHLNIYQLKETGLFEQTIFSKRRLLCVLRRLFSNTSRACLKSRSSIKY